MGFMQALTSIFSDCVIFMDELEKNFICLNFLESKKSQNLIEQNYSSIKSVSLVLQEHFLLDESVVAIGEENFLRKKHCYLL